ncbi:MAG: sulfotransferase family protein [Actinomycetales bacterium]
MTTPEGLPDFLLIGAFKSGTTSLISQLGQHPEIFVPWMQEPAFFASPRFNPLPGGPTDPVQAPESIYGRLRAESLDQYRALFADAGARVCGESSPQYMRDGDSVGRIHSLLPGVKLIAVLRDPVRRAYSDYLMMVRDGLEQAPFEEAIAREPGSRELTHYVSTGFYGAQLRPYFDLFGPDQLRIVLFEELVREPAATMRTLYEWLGVDPGFSPVVEVLNESGVPSNAAVAQLYRARRRLQPYLKPVVPRRLAKSADKLLVRGLRKTGLDEASSGRLREIYTDDLDLLCELAGRDLREAWA